jgi:hypothetical protein
MAERPKDTLVARFFLLLFLATRLVFFYMACLCGASDEVDSTEVSPTHLHGGKMIPMEVCAEENDGYRIGGIPECIHQT